MRLLRAVGVPLTAAAVGCTPAAPQPPAASPPAASPTPDATTPGTSPPTEAATEAATEPARSGTLPRPRKITKAYVQQVMDGLDAHLRDTARAVKREKAFGEEWLARLQAVYSETAIEGHRRDWQAIGVKGIRTNPKPPRTKVLRVIDARPGCIYATAERHYEPMVKPRVLQRFGIEQPWYLVLGHVKPTRYNRTGWNLWWETWARRPGKENPCDVG